MDFGALALHGGDTHEPTPEEKRELNIIKGVFIVVVFFLTIFAGMLPIKVKACKESPTFIGLANAFSGGLFLAIALFHVLPETADQYNDYYKDLNGEDPKWPLPYMLAFGGYSVILMVDRVMFDSHALFEGEDGHGGHGHGHGNEKKEKGHEHDHGHGHAKDNSNTRNTLLEGIKEEEE
jgi:solute carrier family 39 (zinc transporter), member 1/2/3